MSGVFRHADGATPLTWEEMQDVIPVHIAYRRDLDEAEQANILRGQDWALGRRRAILDEKFIRTLHKRMFGDVWRWAGRFRTSARNIGIDHWLIPVALRQALEDCAAWQEFESYSPDEIAVRLHHKLVWIHPFPNGNGRHARLVADLLLMQAGRERFSWGRATLREAGEMRERYIGALRRADGFDMAPLVAFARS